MSVQMILFFILLIIAILYFAWLFLLCCKVSLSAVKSANK